MECCRICLSSNNLTNIFESEDIANNIIAIACVDINQNDGLPQYICFLCKHELDICISFKDKCESTFEMLKEQHAKEIEVKEEIILNLLSGGSVLDEKLPEQARKCILNTVKNNVMENVGADKESTEEFENEVEYETKIEEQKVPLHNYDDEVPMGNDNGDETSDQYVETQLQNINSQDFTCQVCHLNFMDEESFLNHLERLHPTTMGQCQICLVYFPTEQVLKEHLSEKHDILDDNIFRCKICFKTFELQSQLSSHLCSPTGKKNFRCDLCQVCFTLECELENHIRFAHQKVEFTCAKCPKSFRFYDNYKRHLSEHIIFRNQVRMIQCPQCQKFTSSTKWKEHACESTTVEDKENPYKCPECCESFARRSDLTAHLHTHIGSKPHVCSICQKAFFKGTDLENHLLLHENLIKRTKEEFYVFKATKRKECGGDDEAIGEVLS